MFCDEQGVSREAEFDGLDDQADQVVGVEDGELIATCRLLFDEGRICKLGRMAVARSHRRTGAGRRLLAAAEHLARERGAGQILLHAQRQAEEFYAACRYRPEGPTFDEEGIPHVRMRKSIPRD